MRLATKSCGANGVMLASASATTGPASRCTASEMRAKVSRSVFVRLVRLKENLHEAEAFARTWRKRGVPVFVYTANNRDGSLDGWQEQLALPEERVSAWYKARRRLARMLIRHCPIPFSTANILHDGQMLMCVHDWQRNEILGNVRQQAIAEIWNGPRMREIRRLVSERRYEEVGSCRDCSLWREGWF